MSDTVATKSDAKEESKDLEESPSTDIIITYQNESTIVLADVTPNTISRELRTARDNIESVESDMNEMTDELRSINTSISKIRDTSIEACLASLANGVID